jgi:hypothetical protein
MLTYLPSRDDVIACRLSGRMSAEEMENISNKVIEAVERYEKTHIYAEIDGMTGFDVKAWVDQVQRAWPLLGKLRRFGRIAVVTDQPWLRWGTRIESALLPGISYEVFDLAERERALAWVEGKIEQPHDSRLAILPAKQSNVIAFELTGRVSAEAMEDAVGEITARLDSIDGPVRILGIFRRFRMPEAKGVLDTDYFRMKLSAFRRVERYAVVGGPSWFRAWVDLLKPLLRFEVRHFEAHDEAGAWDWVGAHPAQVAREEASGTA